MAASYTASDLRTPLRVDVRPWFLTRSANAAGPPAVSGCHDFRYIRHLDLSLPDLNEGADNAAAHFIEKSVTFDHEGQQWSLAKDIAAPEGAHGIFQEPAAV